MEYRQNRDLYQNSQSNGMGRGSWTPRGRGGFQRGEVSSFAGSRGVGSYFGEEGGHDQGDHDVSSSLEKTLSGMSLGKTFSGSVDGSDASGRLQRAQSRGFEGSYQSRGSYPMGPMRGGSGDLGTYSPGRMGGRGEACAAGQWQGRGRGMGPVRCNPTLFGLRHACDIVIAIYILRGAVCGCLARAWRLALKLVKA